MSSNMRVSDKGIVEIAEHEGVVPAPYKDSVSVWTYGVGHTAAAGGVDPASMDKAMPTGVALDAAVDRALALFKVDLGKYEKRVNDAIKVPLLQHEFDALVSFDFNTGGIYRAKLTAAINAGDKSGAGFMGWLSPPEIRKRRTAEMNLFKTGDYDANGTMVPIWKTNGAGKLMGLQGSMSGVELLKRMHGNTVQPDMSQQADDTTAQSGVWWLDLIMRILGK
jgi:lysozyme